MAPPRRGEPTVAARESWNRVISEFKSALQMYMRIAYWVAP